jgi:CRP-like cAMP-binding protein
MAQGAGRGLYMSADAFRGEIAGDGKLRELLLGYTQALFAQISQSVACNGTHSIQERCARWLLGTHDRAGADQFVLTQEFLADMLAVRRPSVTVAAGMLQKAGLIEYRRGHITILDRPGLEASSCECYRAILDAYETFVPIP